MPTLPAGSVIAAYPTPPADRNSATDEITIAADGRRRNNEPSRIGLTSRFVWSGPVGAFASHQTIAAEVAGVDPAADADLMRACQILASSSAST